MDRGLRGVFFSCILITLFLSSSAQTCFNYAFESNMIFEACNDLPFLNSFLHYTYNPSSQTLQIAYRHTGIDSSRWVAWAINPTSQGMIGSQALVAFSQPDGTVKAYTSPMTSYRTMLQEGDLSFPVSDLSATYSNNEMIIFATLGLQNGSTTMNQVWQDGPVSGNAPGIHATSGNNVKSMETLNLLSGQSGSAAGGAVGGSSKAAGGAVGGSSKAAGGAVGGSSKTKKRNTHGVLNTISWGIMMPVGVLIARYMRVFQSADPLWFYLHVFCQGSAYVISVAGWGTGMWLGSHSPGIQFTSHRIIGIILFSVATLQVFALLIRPNKDHKYRLYWNIYHHSSGYIIIILGIINIFKGFDILNPTKKWERAYTGIIIVLAIVAALLEVYTWFIVCSRRKEARTEKMTNGNNGLTYGHNGYGGRANERA